MKQGATQWLLGLGLVAFPLGCLVLALYLAYHPPAPFEAAGETPTISKPSTVKKLPDFAGIDDIPARKRSFFGMLLPMAEWRNHQLRQIRQDVEAMLATLNDGEALSSSQRRELERLRNHFRVSEDNYSDTEEALLVLKRRADVIPVEMVLAQAAAESGWGTSRFARRANNLFGQWCYRKGCGLVPSRRVEGASHEVQKFSTVNDAVSTYYRNINTNRAYREVREIRARQREKGQEPSGMAMVEGLTRYSSRGQAYVEELKELIRYNNLERVKEVWFAQAKAESEPAEGEAGTAQ